MSFPVQRLLPLSVSMTNVVLFSSQRPWAMSSPGNFTGMSNKPVQTSFLKTDQFKAQKPGAQTQKLQIIQLLSILGTILQATKIAHTTRLSWGLSLPDYVYGVLSQKDAASRRKAVFYQLPVQIGLQTVAAEGLHWAFKAFAWGFQKMYRLGRLL